MVVDEVVYDSNDNRVITKLPSISPDGKDKRILLTFDDGPSRYCNDFLDILQKENVKALFFWQSRLLHDKRPWERLIQEGHIIGTHSCKHRNLGNLTFEEQFYDICYSIVKMESITGIRPTYFRPPYGVYNDLTIKAVKQLNLKPMMWTVASMDWELKDEPEKIIDNVVGSIENGSIVLLHELKQTLSVLPELIQEIKKKGFTFGLPD